MSRYNNTKTAYKRALKVIPLASQTFSKSAMHYVEGASPLFLDRGNGAHVWDVDGNEYVDYVMGLLPIILGYCDPDVDAAIREQLGRGISFSLATELEAELSERLVELIPCAEMVRFGKNGSDATTAAVRLARAFTGRDRVAVCGYHGWHDWYIGTTVRHLGVPDAVRQLSSNFSFNDINSLDKLLCDDPSGFAAVILEPAGGMEPEAKFLSNVRDIADRYGVVLIFDEIVTGFRLGLGGGQQFYGVTPDLACFGKAMGNGMPISAIVGRADIMEMMEQIFYSGTFGGEALSLAASIATIEKVIREDVVTKIWDEGKRLKEDVSGILESHDLEQRFVIRGPDWRPLITSSAVGNVGVIANSLLRQELLANGILMGGAFNIAFAHMDDRVKQQTHDAWAAAAKSVSVALRSNDPEGHLRGKPIKTVFQVREK